MEIKLKKRYKYAGDVYAELIKNEFTPSYVSELIDKVPDADVAPVVHGKWRVSEYEFLDCSVCGESMYTGCNSTKEAIILAKHWKKYCPNCGAKMDLEG